MKVAVDVGGYELSGWGKRSIFKAEPAAVFALEPSAEVESVDAEIEELLRTSCITLVRGSYFEERLAHGSTIQPRQNIDPCHIWQPDEAIKLWKLFGRLFLIIISYA